MSDIPVEHNQPDELKIRKYRDTLVTGGLAIIAFGSWTVIKGIIEASRLIRSMIESGSFEELIQMDKEVLKGMAEDNSLFYSLMAIVIVLLIVDLSLRVYVGLSARAIGLGKKKRNGKERNGIGWVISGLFIVIIDGYSLITSMLNGVYFQGHSVTYVVVSLFVDIIPLFVTLELVYTGFRLRRLTRKKTETGEVRYAA